MRHLLSVNDLRKNEILEIFRITDEIKGGKMEGLLQGKTLSLLFEKPSTRTRVSFQSAMFLLRGNSIYLDAKRTQMSRGETYGDTARVLSLYSNFIAARMNRHGDLLAFAKESSVPVINALTDLEHPCQALSDIYTIREIKGELKGTKIAFIGDIDANTANSLMLASTKLEMGFSLVGPVDKPPFIGYGKATKTQKDGSACRNQLAIYLRKARKQGTVEVHKDIRRGLSGADIVYTDTWVSMGEEAEHDARIRLFSEYQLNKKTLGYAKRGARVMHCLPAHRGEEITSDVLDGPQSIVMEQAKNKMYVEAAILTYLDMKSG